MSDKSTKKKKGQKKRISLLERDRGDGRRIGKMTTNQIITEPSIP